MRIRRNKRNIDYSSSIIEMYQFQHEITHELNEADQLELEANRLIEAAENKRRFANDKMKVLIGIANEYYTLDKLKSMLKTEQKPSTRIILVSIIETIENDPCHTQSTVLQLLDIDSDVLDYIQDNYPLTFLGSLDIFITGLKNERK